MDKKKLIILGIAAALAVGGAALKVDVKEVVKNITALSKDISGLVGDAPAAAEEKPAE